jgi:PAS domain S-box-containing protein
MDKKYIYLEKPEDLSREEYFNILNKSRDSVIILQGGRTVFMNTATSELTGWKAEEVLGKKFVELLPPEEKKKVYGIYLKRLLGQPVPKIYETKIIKKDGGFVYSEIAGTKIEWRGKPASLAYIRDISNLKNREKIFESVFYGSPVGIEIYDTNGLLLNANKACLDIFGVADIKDVRGFNLFEDQSVNKDIKNDLFRGKSVKYETNFDFEKVKKAKLYKTKKSGIIAIDVQIKPLEGVGFLVLVQDVTERRDAEKKLRKMSEEAKKRVEDLERFRDLVVGREERMISLKKEIENLKKNN